MPPESSIIPTSLEAANYNLVQDMVDRVIGENSVTQPPVRIFEIVRNYGLDIAFAQLDGYDSVAGFVDLESHRIVINEWDNATRQKFTAAHELGHWLMHRHLIETDPDKGVLLRVPLNGPDPDPREKEANAFAAKLLVPDTLLQRYKLIIQDNSGFVDDEAVYGASRMFASIFGVSQELMSYRLRSTY